MEPLERVFQSTVLGFQASLRQHMPASAYREFSQWATSDANPELKTWLQIIGIPQFAKLTYALLNGCVASDKWDELVRYSSIMNAYLIYETVSDNLAFGLALRQPDDTTYDLRRDVLIGFNRAMVAGLQGDTERSERILADIEDKADQLSGFKHSITDAEQQAFAELFLTLRPNHTRDMIEFGTWNALVANVRACVETCRTVSELKMGEILRQGLIRRYTAVNTLLLEQIDDRQTLMRVSTDTILVVPVLAYYVAVIAEVLEPNPALAGLIEDGTLPQALEDAALMVRLLNDIGTNLVATDEFHRRLLNGLYADFQSSGHRPEAFPYMLMAQMGQAELAGVMTRIRKDVSLGEFNLSLHDLMTAPSSLASLLRFGDNLLYCKAQYKQCRSRLSANLQTISETLGSQTIAALIYKFVAFHEEIYKHQFDHQAGDYATKPDRRTSEMPTVRAKAS